MSISHLAPEKQTPLATVNNPSSINYLCDQWFGRWVTCEPGHAGADISRSNLLTSALILAGIQEALVENLIYQQIKLSLELNETLNYFALKPSACLLGI